LAFECLGFPFFISVNRMSTKIVSTEFVNAVDGNSTEFIKWWDVQ